MTGLSPGRHTARVSKDGFLEWRSDYYIESGATTAVWAELRPEPEHWFEKWWVWSIVGGVVAAGAGVAIWALQPDEKVGALEFLYRRETAP